MEFDFKKDYFSDKAKVKVSMGHEAFGLWLEQEGQQAEWVQGLLDKLSQLQKAEINEYRLVGSEFSLLLTREEAKITNHSLQNVDPDEVAIDELSFYDQEIQAECGLEDFINLIEAWFDFI